MYSLAYNIIHFSVLQAACVHFPSHSPCNLRLLLLLYSNKRQSFLGIIPNDQNGVVNGVKQVILEKKVGITVQVPKRLKL